MKEALVQKLKKIKLLPVAVIEDAADAVPLGRALLEADLPAIEVTFRTEAAAASIFKLKEAMPHMLVGAGTVLTIDQVKSAVGANAEFIVTPGFNPKVVDYCVDNGIPVIPGVNTPSFIEWGLDRGLTFFKFFPADFSGGPGMVSLMQGPYPMARFMPTGGIDNSNITSYLKLKNVIACGGSWMVKKDLISSRQFETITALTKEALSVIAAALR